tara:strand:+ start:1000 stop:1833 length:834 start_codon:yes stop_codon:yes gene_type:complete
MKISVCSVATTKSLKEFELLKFTFEQYHEADWFVASDDYAAKALEKYDNVTIINSIKTDDCSHGVNDPVKNRLFLELIMTKFDVMELAIEKNGYGLFLDSDIFFTNALEDRFLKLLLDPDVDAILSPHMTNNLALETQVGHYNVGFFAVRNIDYLRQHREMSWKSKEFGMYYEQQPLQFTSYEYLTVNAPIYYNIGWWRFNESHNQQRLQFLEVADDRVCFMGRPAVCFHVHTMKSLDYNNQGKFLVDKVFKLMSTTKNKKYGDLFAFVNGLIDESK